MGGDGLRCVAELELGRESDAVPQARRLTRAALAGGWEHLADDAELVVSELVTNATLHGVPPILVRVLAGGRVRVEVSDEGRSAPIVLRRNTEAMTGRGLAMVGALSSAWGVDPSAAGGKVVWAELGGEGGAVNPGTDAGRDIEALLAAWSDEDLSPATYTVRLGAVSTDLLLSAKAHIDNVVRELTLMREGEAVRGNSLPPDLEALVETVTVDFAAARSEIKRQAVAAAGRGDELTDLELHLPTSAADAGERYLVALDQADRYARASNLLTLAPPRVHRLFRQWYVGSLVDQLRALSSGQEPAPPRSFQVVLADEIGHLEEQADVSARLSLLQTVTAELADARGLEDMAWVVVDNAVRLPGVETARVRLVTGDGMLRSVAWRSRDPSAAEPLSEYSVDADLPGARAVRTGQAQFTRSPTPILQALPELAGQYPGERSSHLVPLTVGAETLGILSLTFASGELSDRTEVAVVEALARALAQALRRAQLTSRDHQQREALEFLADALGILISAEEPAQVLERLVAHSVPRLADWCAVYVVDGPLLRRVAVTVDGNPELSERLRDGPPISLDADIPHTRVLRTGRPEPIHDRIGPVLHDLYPGVDFSPIGTDWGQASGLCAPMELRGRRVGVIAITFLRDGRRVTPEVAQVLSGLADRAAIALDIAELRSGQRQPEERVVLDLAVGAGGIGTFDWDLVTGRLVWDERLLDIFGLDRDRFELTIEQFYDQLHPGDLEPVREKLQEAIDSCGEYDAEYRIVLPDGGTRWVAARGRALGDADGRAVRLIGAAQDTTARRDAEARIARVMDSMSTAFFFLDRHWRFNYVNTEATRVLGRAAAELLGSDIWELFPAALGSDFERFYRHAASSGEPVAFDAFYPEPLNAWYEVRAWPHPEGLAVYFMDVTDRRRAHDQAQRAIGRAGLLGRVTEELAAIVDPVDAMRALARLIVPDLADWSVVTLIEDESRAGTRRGLRDAAGWHARPELRDMVGRYAGSRLGMITDDSIVVRAVESAEAQVIPEDAMSVLRPMFEPGAEALGLLEQLAPHAVVLLPLNGRRRPVGMLTLCRDAPHGFDVEDLELARDVAARAGLVLDRARLYRQQREVAEALQRSMLTAPPVIPSMRIAVRYVPAAEAAQVGGDWYDAFHQADGSVVLVIGDVMGHDVDAAAAMGQVRTLVRGMAAHSGQGPAQVLRDVEATMDALRLDTTATAVLARAEPDGSGNGRGCRFGWSNAGHPPPIRLDPDGTTTVLGPGSGDLLLGAMPGTPRHEHQTELPVGSTVILYTDGLVEQRDQPVDRGVERLQGLLRSLAGSDIEQLCDEVLRRMLPDRPGDDVALLAVRITGPRDP
ncbi:MAG TPA: SpoIIE family protein phosphatase [Acidimicrobiales bacterium]|nr:SpoIIE family protein phosphatase [Acidimicrobiales bacterium]